MITFRFCWILAHGSSPSAFDNGSLLLDFGPRQFTVSFDETLKPFVRDASGSRLKDLPKPNKSDDESQANNAVNRYKLLKITVSFDETLKPFVRDASGSRLKDLPKPNKSDDESQANNAVNRYKLLKKDARTVAAQQVARLESAMCLRRRWSPENFQLFPVFA